MMQTFFRILAASAALAGVLAAPSAHRLKRTDHGDAWQNLLLNCDTSEVVPDFLPPHQTNVTVPAGQVPRFITIGVGLQNYTCTDGKYASVGAVATLFDVSCLATSPFFPHLQSYIFDALNDHSSQSIADFLLFQATLNIGDHYFSPTPDGKIKPVFDFTNTLKNKREFVDVKRDGGTPSPESSSHVDWLSLSRTDGELADTVLRIGTHLGQPPALCKDGDKVEMPYAAHYWFYKKKST